MQRIFYPDKKILGMWKLLPNAWQVMRYGWSFRLMILAAILSGIEAAMGYFYQYYPVPPGLFALATVIVSTAASFARLVAQPKTITPPLNQLPEALKPYADKPNQVQPEG